MSSSGGNMLPFTLSDELKLRGHENYKSWKQQMLIQGKPRGLDIYWGGKATATIHIPTASTSTSGVTTTTTAEKSAINDLKPSALEFGLHESVALSSILGNIIDIDGAGIEEAWDSNVVWTYLNKQYGQPSDRMRTIMEKGAYQHSPPKKGNDAGSTIDTPRFIVILLDSFPESWDVITTPLYKEKDLTSIITDLTIHGERLISRGMLNEKTTSTIPKGRYRPSSSGYNNGTPGLI
ncbi:hypothetical protein BT96DRAFT_1005823 [Gymnopus androsaceus JB14]|uniref:Retrotransposon Copia-like N-terminal domain-containing protein n=1 Tax=Gymnopus androsaceus JB14 TaxID=1447944 RepID=A0A6A4GLX7_9AGAR|nr:hypothetical protein BT96DRAFT_1005823 [Gymnopus androsaceus JB14]